MSQESDTLNVKASKLPNPTSKKFYICSYGGSGSYMLKRALKQYGHVEHIHSRKPPEKLEYVGKNADSEWFNGIPIKNEDLKNYYVIYIYKNPIKAIYSRFWHPLHLKHIQCNENLTFNDVLKSKKDLYGLEEFFDNYTKKNVNRNYKIICIKYDDIFKKHKELSKLLDVPKLKLVKRETDRPYPDYDKFKKIYKNLLKKIDNLDSIHIV